MVLDVARNQNRSPARNILQSPHSTPGHNGHGVDASFRITGVHDGGRVQQLPHRRGHSFKCSRGTQCAYPTQTPTATHVLQRIDVKRGLFVGVRLYESVDYRGHSGRWYQCLPSYLFRPLQPSPHSDVWVGALAGHEGSPPLGIEGTMAVVSERTGSSFIRSSNHVFICLPGNEADELDAAHGNPGDGLRMSQTQLTRRQVRQPAFRRIKVRVAGDHRDVCGQQLTYNPSPPITITHPTEWLEEKWMVRKNNLKIPIRRFPDHILRNIQSHQESSQPAERRPGASSSRTLWMSSTNICSPHSSPANTLYTRSGGTAIWAQ